MSKTPKEYWAIETPDGDVIPEMCGFYSLYSWLSFMNLLRRRTILIDPPTVEHAQKQGYKAVKLVRAE